MLNRDQVAAIRQANLDLFFGLSSMAVEGVGKLAALNMQAIRATLSDTFDLAQKSLSLKEPQGVVTLKFWRRKCAEDAHLLRKRTDLG